ncbi:DegT/DnrJ/EryC1/StrS family aminotransferase [Methylobacterium sp. Gmos1]
MVIPVTKPFLPERVEFERLIDGVWSRNWLTNNGPLVNELEIKLKERISVDHLLFVTNGTVALEYCIRSLGKKGNVITTPFTYIATASSLVWHDFCPIFVDIDEETFNISPDSVEKALQSTDAVAILATHVFGNPCHVVSLQNIAQKYNTALIYDAAHAFGVSINSKSVATFGDMSAFSFHATKLFHTVEGGGVVTREPNRLARMAAFRNFGHITPDTFSEAGINGKNSEFHAAMGLAVLPHLDKIILRRKELSVRYNTKLENSNIKRQKIDPQVEYNYAYYPALFESEAVMLSCKQELEAHNIFPRRYFYPALSDIPFFNSKKISTATDIASRILCLPLYHELSFEEVDLISRIILRTIRYRSS